MSLLYDWEHVAHIELLRRATVGERRQVFVVSEDQATVAAVGAGRLGEEPAVGSRVDLLNSIKTLLSIYYTSVVPLHNGLF